MTDILTQPNKFQVLGRAILRKIYQLHTHTKNEKKKKGRGQEANQVDSAFERQSFRLLSVTLMTSKMRETIEFSLFSRVAARKERKSKKKKK
jgi:hypothetical protein